MLRVAAQTLARVVPCAKDGCRSRAPRIIARALSGAKGGQMPGCRTRHGALAPVACLDRDWPPQANSIPATSSFFRLFYSTAEALRGRRVFESRRLTTYRLSKRGVVLLVLFLSSQLFTRHRTERGRDVRADDRAAFDSHGIDACRRRARRVEPHVARRRLPAPQGIGRLDGHGDARRQP
jgi:hypothetical protein